MQAWSSYWSAGALHSCIGSFDANYSGAIGTFWDRLAADMRPGDRVLDLATGNGALPLRLWQQRGSGTASVHIDAVDQAALAPDWYQPDTHPQISFHPGVSMEALPFAAGRYDWIVSQFGIEYARRPESLDECLRVLKPDGRVALVMHHAGSVLVSVGRTELANLELLLAPDGLIAATAGAVPWIARARGGAPNLSANAEAGQARARYNQAMAAVTEAIGASPVPDALHENRQWVHGLLSGAAGIDPRAQLQALEAHRQALQAAALRTGEMVEHALDEAAVEQIAQHLRQARPQCVTRCAPLSQAEGVLGWALTCAPTNAAAA